MIQAPKELGEAIIVNPNNREEIAAALKEALELPAEEQRRRNRLMKNRLQRYNITRWTRDFLQELASMDQVQRKFCAKILSPAARHKLIDHYKSSSLRILLLDYDGTLTPLVRYPAMAKPTEEILALLTRLSVDPCNTVVLISGRDKDVLQEWFGALPVRLVAEHGIWLKEVGGEWTLLKPQAHEWKAHILPILQLYADRLPGAMVEEKDYSSSPSIARSSRPCARPRRAR